VLINTAGFLQSQAEATGEESTSQVADGLQVQTSTAVASGGDISTIELKVGLAAGSNPVNVTESTIEWVGENNATTLNVEDVDGSANAGSGDTSESHAFVDQDADSLELTSQGDTTTIYISAGTDADAIQTMNDDSLTGDSADLPMTEGDRATVTITTSSGAQTVTELSVPNILQDGQGVDL
jgi:flagellin FlaB